ncbi:hypothetical protein ABZ942_19965 [Nocardia sp. NPDC046473]|uniref:hypothetical protein n=1 Tax=Nocardia sp. NPDC046473 TaxID=3155733 RepID=UPI00340E3765
MAEQRWSFPLTPVLVLVLVAVTVALAASGCGGGSDLRSSTVSATPTSQVASGSVTASGVTVSGKVGAIGVTATAPTGVADVGTHLVMSAAPAPTAKAFDVEVGAAPPVVLVLGNGAQPGKPVTLKFDLSGSPDLYGKFTDSVRPVIAVEQGGDKSKPDLLLPNWDTASKTLTTTTDHLSTFQVTLVDAGAALDRAVRQAWQTVAGSLDSPCKDKSDINIGPNKLTLAPSKPGVVAACLRDTGAGIAVDFTSNSAQYFRVAATPAGKFTNAQPLSGADQLAVALHDSFDHQSGLLSPKGTGTLLLPPGTMSAQLHLDVDLAALQLETILTGLDMLGADGDALVAAFQNSKAGYDCLVTLYQSWTTPNKPDTAEFTKALGDVAQCGLTGAEAAVGNQDAHRVLHRMSVAVSLFTTLPSQLLANITGIIGEFTGDNHLEFTMALGISGSWSGTWTTSDGETYPATLQVSQDAPVKARMDIPGYACGANWSEAKRNSTLVYVDAAVTYGTCANNTWVLTITGTSIAGDDTSSDGTHVEFHRN